MIDFLLQIVDVLKIAVNFFVHTIQSIYDFVFLIPRALTFVTAALLYVPSVFTAYIMAGIGVSVILVIVGRNK